VTVRMPGGNLRVQVSREFDVTITGPVTRIAEGRLFQELFL
jgi:diaminopimelate epimerase